MSKEPEITMNTEDWQCRSSRYRLIKILSVDQVCSRTGETVAAIVENEDGNRILLALFKNGRFCRDGSNNQFDLIPRKRYDYRSLNVDKDGVSVGVVPCPNYESVVDKFGDSAYFMGVVRRELPNGKWELVTEEKNKKRHVPHKQYEYRMLKSKGDTGVCSIPKSYSSYADVINSLDSEDNVVGFIRRELPNGRWEFAGDCRIETDTKE